MKCPKCAVNIPKNTVECPQCGTIVQPVEQQVKATLQNKTKRKVAWPLIILPILIVLCCISLVIVVAAGLIVQQSDFSLTDLIPDKVDQIFTQEPVLDESPSWVSESPDSMPNLYELSEQQQMTVDQLSWPDTFIIMEIDDMQGNHVRLETWVYCQGKTSYTFTDGIFQSDGEAITLPDGYFPTPYYPNQFPLGASLDQIQSMLTNSTLVPFENSGFIQEGVDLYISQQLILGFLEDRLFYVDAMALIPEGDI